MRGAGERYGLAEPEAVAQVQRRGIRRRRSVARDALLQTTANGDGQERGWHGNGGQRQLRSVAYRWFDRCRLPLIARAGPARRRRWGIIVRWSGGSDMLAARTDRCIGRLVRAGARCLAGDVTAPVRRQRQKQAAGQRQIPDACATHRLRRPCDCAKSRLGLYREHPWRHSPLLAVDSRSRAGNSVVTAGHSVTTP